MAETVATMAAEQLAVERAYVAMLYDRLDELRAEKTAELAAVRRSESFGNHQNRAERDAFASHYEDRLAQLEAVDHRLVFGRLDGQDGDRGPEFEETGDRGAVVGVQGGHQRVVTGSSVQGRGSARAVHRCAGSASRRRRGRRRGRGRRGQHKPINA